MSTITKELLLEEARQGVEGCHRLLRISPNSKAHRISLCLAEIALASLEAEPVAYLIERHEGFRGYGPARSIVDAKYYSPLSSEFWSPGAQEHHTVTPLYAAMLQSFGNSEQLSSPVIPDGYCIMPIKLTSANGAKGALSGEFHVIHRVVCQSCGGEGCEDCNEEGGWDAEIPVSWDTIKRIHDSAVEACALPAAPQQEVKP